MKGSAKVALRKREEERKRLKKNTALLYLKHRDTQKVLISIHRGFQTHVLPYIEAFEDPAAAAMAPFKNTLCLL